MGGDEGRQLQLLAENQTHEIAKPYPSYIPTIVFNRVSDYHLNTVTVSYKQMILNSIFPIYSIFFKVFNSRHLWQSLDDFPKVACEQLSIVYCSDALPDICKNYKKTSDSLLQTLFGNLF